MHLLQHASGEHYTMQKSYSIFIIIQRTLLYLTPFLALHLQCMAQFVYQCKDEAILAKFSESDQIYFAIRLFNQHPITTMI